MAERMRDDLGPRIDQSGPAKLSVRTNGWTWFDRTWQLTVLAVSPLVIIMLAFLAQPPYPADFIPRLIGGVIILAFADILIEEIVSVRGVEIDREGVTFHYLFHRERGAWTDLFPDPSPPQHGSWFIGRLRHRRSQKTVRGHRVTLEQARAILTYPACPEWSLVPSVESSLGVRTSNLLPQH